MKFSTAIFLISMILFTYIQSATLKGFNLAQQLKGDQFYEIVSKHSGKCLDVAGNGKHNGANIHQWTCHGGNNQKWKILYTDEGTSVLMSAASGNVVDVAGASKGKGGNAHSWQLHGGKNQQWHLAHNAQGWYTIKSVWSGKVLDIHAYGKQNGANIYQWTLHGGANQLWELRATKTK